MGTIDPRISNYYDRDGYWHLVEETLGKVFQHSLDPARELRKDVDTWAQEEQLFFYHSEPLDVAADIAGEAVTRDHTSMYLGLVARITSS